MKYLKRLCGWIVMLTILMMLWVALPVHIYADLTGKQASSAKNLIVISLDTLRGDRLGCYGCSHPISPFIDRLSRRLVLFADVLSQTPSTITSHRSIFTSKYLNKQSLSYPEESETLAGRFRAAGWRTGAFVDGGLMHSRYGNSAGFQIYDDSGGGLAAVCRKGLEWCVSKEDTPFFLFLHTYDIHCPYDPPYPYSDMFRPDTPFPYETEGKCGRTYFNNLPLTDEDKAHISGLYDGGVRACDTQLMVFFAELEQRGMIDDTVIVILSDHGESLGERNYIGHCQVYDTQLSVPLLFYLPGNKGFIASGPAENIDIMPTLLALFDLPVPGGVEGKNLTRMLTGGVHLPADRNRIAENHSTTARAIYSPDQWKLIIRKDPADDELYRPLEDPCELKNRITEFPAVVRRLRNTYTETTGVPESSSRAKFQTRIIRTTLMQEGHAEEDALTEQLKKLGYVY